MSWRQVPAQEALRVCASKFSGMERGDPTRLPKDRNTHQVKTFPASWPIRPRADDKLVIQMNGSLLRASDWVQCVPPRLQPTIKGLARGCPRQDPSKRRPTMLKTISAALLAASVIAAPAFAAETGKTTTTTPVIKADQAQTKVSTTAAKPDAGLKADAKTSDAKTSDVKADAKVDAK